MCMSVLYICRHSETNGSEYFEVNRSELKQYFALLRSEYFVF
jgi:hypothetical protein